MNFKRQSLLLLGQEEIVSLIPASLLNQHPDYFLCIQQLSSVEINKESFDSNSIIQYFNFSQTTTPNTSAQQKQTYSSKSGKNKQIRSFFPQKWPLQKNNLSPFSFSKYSQFQSLTNRYWYYLDNENIVQGPFSCVEMDNWYRKNLLNPELLVSFKTLDLTSFIRVKDILSLQNNKDNKNQSYLAKQRSQSLSILSNITKYTQELGYSVNSPSSRGSTELSNSNTNSCQRQRQIWSVENRQKHQFQEYVWVQ